jgi:two-component system OmpR family response regulator
MGDRPSPLNGLRILVVDSDQDSLMLLNYFFSAYGVDTVMAESVHEALNILRQQPVDLLITEVALPITDGYSLLHQLPVNVPAIAVTSYLPPGGEDQAIAAGFGACLTKPIDLDQLIAVVGRLTSHVRLDAAE